MKEQPESIAWYRVRKSWADAKSQIGAYKILENAKKCAVKRSTMRIYRENGRNILELVRYQKKERDARHGK